MKKYTILIIASLFSTPLWASPISVFIDSHETLKKLGVTIKHEKESGSENHYVKVSWRPEIEDAQLLPRIDLVHQHSKEEKITVEIPHYGKHRFTFNFWLRGESHSKNTTLVFWNGQNIVHGLVLSDFIKDFEKAAQKRDDGAFGFEK